jgi:hypothetical protein
MEVPMFPILLTFRIIIFLLLLPFFLFWRMRRKGRISRHGGHAPLWTGEQEDEPRSA